ncbi:hypothetical protein PHISP_04579 [Aspergillus sp. HF37]|nr:hypothetical protein PHISP_04579 [Aspergillus sp. HF37]
MPSYLKFAAAALTAMLPLSSAQTYTECDPLKKTCPPNDGLARSSFTSDFTKGDSALDDWKITAGEVTTGPDGAEFTIRKQGDAPTIQTPWYFFFGKVEIEMKIAPGKGIVSSTVMQSSVLDEVDWEGLGTRTDEIQANYFGKGDTSSYDRESWHPLETPQDTFHTYTIEWKKDHITWAIDGKDVRTVTYDEAKGGTRFPQTPVNFRIGSWAGGDPSNPQGTIEWAGGLTDYTKGPYTMYVRRVHIENENPAESYKYTDHSGSYKSIKFAEVDGGSDSSSSSSTTEKTTAMKTTMSTATTGSGSTATTGSSSEGTTTDSASSTGGSGSGSGSSSGSSSTAGPGSSSGSRPSSSSGAGSGSSSSSGTGSGSSSSIGPGSSSSSSVPVQTGAASALTGLPLTFVGLFTAMLQL